MIFVRVSVLDGYLRLSNYISSTVSNKTNAVTLVERVDNAFHQNQP